MLSVSLPCPACSAALLLDEENADQEVICPGCEAYLRLPAKVSAAIPPVLLQPGSGGTGANPAEPFTTDPRAGKSQLPLSRSKSVEDERKRLAAAAAAAGGANQFSPQEATLPHDRQPSVLPSKRAVSPVKVKPEIAATTDAELSFPSNTTLPVRRTAGAPLEPRPTKATVQPIEPREDVEISVRPLTGPSRFVHTTEPASEASISPKGLAEEFAEGLGEASEEKGDTVKGGFRLGGGRQLHFSPAPSTESDGEAPTWGAKLETEEQAAKSRRFVSLAVIIALIAAVGIGIYVTKQAFAKPAQTTELSDDAPLADPKTTENVMKNVEDAKRVLQRFLAADTVEKMAAEVRHPDITQPRMERFYAATPLKPRKTITQSQSWNEIRIGNTEFIRGGLELDDFRMHAITLEIVADGEPKVDWESYVSWAELPWKDFLRTPPERSMDYRVTVTLDRSDQYYNYYSKGRELDLICFKVEDPEKYGSCWAYCDKGSEAATQLLFNLKRSRQQGVVNDQGKIAISCMLRLRFPPEGMKTNQVMIEKFLHDSWIEP